MANINDQWRQWVDSDTGEMVEGMLITKEEFEEKAEKQKNKEEGYFRKNKNDALFMFIDENYGSFYFNNYTKLLKALNNDSALLFRFLYLCTFADYDNYLKFGEFKNNTHHAYMKESDFEEVFGLSRRSILTLKTDLISNKLIKIFDDGRIMINSNFYSRGILKDNDMLNSSRVFDNGIRELYFQSKIREHKKIGIIVVLLPYLNKFHNVLCKRPFEENIENIQPLNLTEICKILDYDDQNKDKIKKNLQSITVGGDPMVAYVSHALGKFFIVNPAIFYKGNSLSDLKSLINIFKVRSPKNDSKLS